MGKWDVKTDFKTIRISVVCLIIFVVYIIASQKLTYVGAVDTRSGTVFVGTNLYFYFEFLVSLFVIIISSTMFEETYRQSAMSYIRTLPLNVGQIWIFRYLRLLGILLIIVLPVLLLGIKQVNQGINEFVTIFNLKIENRTVQTWPILFHCMISINFYILLTQAAMILTKNRTMACSILFAYCIMEAGPWGGFLGTNALFYGSFSDIPINVNALPNLSLILIGSALLEVMIVIWYKVKL